jgi:phosphatidylserine decarboxylase
MTLHKEGRASIAIASVVFIALVGTAYTVFAENMIVQALLSAVAVFQLVIILQFFRKPDRTLKENDLFLYSPCDGKVVVIEETVENEFYQDKRVQVSIFMSPLNVHINWYPIKGIVKYFKYHPGKFLVAWHPKSSTDNERTTVVVENKNGFSILLRQIAGALARRIECYAKEGEQIDQGSEMGFIKFGSRVDIFLPVGTKILVDLEEKVTGNRTPIAELPTK